MKTLFLALAVLAPLWVFSQNAGPEKPATAPAAAPAEAVSFPDGVSYVILQDNDIPGLSKKVNDAIHRGLEPAGGVAIHPTGAHFYQAIKRPAPPSKETRRNVVLPAQSDSK